MRRIPSRRGRAFAGRSPLALLALFALVGTGCSCGPESPMPDGGTPDGGTDATVDAGLDGATPLCGPSESECGASCCGADELCGRNLSCCPRDALCGDSCCGVDQVCEGAVCRLDCRSLTRCVAEDGTESCCGADEVCANGACFMPTVECLDFIDCPDGHYCEPTLGSCLPQPTGTECVATPSGGAVTPTLLWEWDGTGAAFSDSNQVIMTPMVANLTDDNGDSRIDREDTPDVVFISYRDPRLQWDGILRALSGDDGSSIFDVTDPALRTIPGGQVAIGDIDGDLLPEIVACSGTTATSYGPLIAFEHDGTPKWTSSDPRIFCGAGAPGIADLDGDGTVEVFVRYSVVNGRDGTTVFHHDCQPTWREREHNPCEYTTAADLDGDASLELVGGNVAFRADGTVYYDRRGDFSDGYPAVGDLDRDGDPEVVIVHSAFALAGAYEGDHWLRVLEHDGRDRLGPIDINQGLAPPADVAADQVSGGGPPTIANVDRDPEPEITLAGAYAYVVFDPDGTLLWSYPTDDASSRKTGSSVFDFDGDGAAEVVYNDHSWLRVFDGADGTVRFCQCNVSATLWEYPVIADVNNDGHAEIVLASNTTSSTGCVDTPTLGPCERARIAASETAGTHGVRVFASPDRDWVPTRRIWNQHSYHITNITESGRVPRRETPNWSVSALNNFRQNLQPGATYLPNLVPANLSTDLLACPTEVTLNFEVTNRGWAASVAGVPVSVYVEEASGWVLLERVSTTRILPPGSSEAFSIPYPLGARPAGDDIHFRVVVNDLSGEPLADFTECRVEDNTAETTASCQILF